MTQNEIIHCFRERFGTGHRIFSAPGRINLIGEHTDYNNGFVLPAAIDKRIYLAVCPVEGSSVRIYSVDFDQQAAFDTKADNADLPHWAKYPFGVIKEFQKAGYFPGGFNAVFGGDIPSGAGLSSSAALECAFAVALNTVFELGMDKLKLVQCCQMAEHHYAGVKCGIMDQFASVFGKKDHVIRLDCRSLDYEYYPLNTGEYQLMLADTRVKHSLASSEYNIRRQECEKGVQILSIHLNGVESLRDVSLSEIRAHKNLMDHTIFKRCEYVVEENQRVLESCQALKNNDLSLLGQLMFQTHEGLSKKYEVSCAELDLLAETAKSIPDVLGARMMGGGFGGCTLNLVKRSALDEIQHKMRMAYQTSFSKEPDFYMVKTGSGAGEVI